MRNNFILKTIACYTVLASVCILLTVNIIIPQINKATASIENNNISEYESSGDNISGYESSGDIVDKINKNIYVITDPDTGVQYLVYSERGLYMGMGGITPRLNPDGSLCIVDTKTEEQTWTAPPQN